MNNINLPLILTVSNAVIPRRLPSSDKIALVDAILEARSMDPALTRKQKIDAFDIVSRYEYQRRSRAKYSEPSIKDLVWELSTKIPKFDIYASSDTFKNFMRDMIQGKENGGYEAYALSKHIEFSDEFIKTDILPIADSLFEHWQWQNALAEQHMEACIKDGEDFMHNEDDDDEGDDCCEKVW